MTTKVQGDGIILPGYAAASRPSTEARKVIWQTDGARGPWTTDGTNWWQLFGESHNAKEHGCKGDGSTDDRANLNTLANTTIPANGGTILLPPGTYKISSAMTFPSNVTLQFMAGATLSPDSSVTVTINSPIIAPFDRQIFGGSGTIKFGVRAKVSPIWWGADRTGATDATSAFQAAHDSLPTTGDVGGQIYIPVGDYLLNQTTQASQFTIDTDNVDVYGDGWSSRLKHTATGVLTGIQAILQIFPGADNITVRNIAIEGPTPSTGAAITSDNRIQGILIHDGATELGVTNVVIDHVLVEKTEIAGIGISSTASNRVDNLRITNCVIRDLRQDGINAFAGLVRNALIANNTIYQTDGFGIEWSGSEGFQHIIGNTIWSTGQSAIGIEYNNTLSPSANVLISGNTITSIYTTGYPNASGIQLGQSANPINTKIIGNYIHFTGGHGITLQGSPVNIDIESNTIQDVGNGGVDKWGIGSAGAVTYVRIKNNIIRTSASGYAMTYGIALAGAGSATNLIEGNEIQGATTAAVSANNPTRVLLYDGSGNFGINIPDSSAAFGASASKVISIGLGTAASSSPADLVQFWVEDESAGVASLTYKGESGSSLRLSGVTRTTIGANGAATALTANPVGYLDITISGTAYQIPYYNRGV